MSPFSNVLTQFTFLKNFRVYPLIVSTLAIHCKQIPGNIKVNYRAGFKTPHFGQPPRWAQISHEVKLSRYPQNTQCILPVEIFARLDLDQTETF